MSDVVVERYGAVLVCRLNRPQDRNGLTGALLRQYLAALEEARTDDACGWSSSTARGDAFSAGADMSDLDGESTRQGSTCSCTKCSGRQARSARPSARSTALGMGRETLAVRNFDNR